VTLELQHAAVPVQKKHVDRRAHPDRVDGAARMQPDAFAGRDARAREQPHQTRAEAG
jgi:hypothetical protein